MRNLTPIVWVAFLLMSAPFAPAQEFPSGDQVGREAMARAQAQKERNDRFVAEQRAAEKAAGKPGAKASPAPAAKPGGGAGGKGSGAGGKGDGGKPTKP
jgi:hypothetical protein